MPQIQMGARNEEDTIRRRSTGFTFMLMFMYTTTHALRGHDNAAEVKDSPTAASRLTR